ncbi:MAG: hypothetical protein QM778_21900 [Myxococcales bacterium]
MPLRNLARPLALLFGVGTLASLWNWASQAWQGTTVRSAFKEPTTSRPYWLMVRSDHDPSRPTPVLFALHAYATAPDVLVRGYSLESLAVRDRGFVVVVPEGMRDQDGQYSWNASSACCGTGPARPDDLAYLDAVLTDVARHYAIDDGHIMALGVSNGGFMAHRWACQAGSKLSAIASISGMGPGPQDPPCAAGSHVAVLQVHGDADEVIHYRGGHMRDASYPSAQDSLAPFLRVSGAEAKPQVRTSRTLLYGRIRKQEWKAGQAPIALWTVEGGPHHLRAAQASVPEILDFLERL